MTILSRVCAEFQDRNGTVLYTIRQDQLLQPLTDAPESIRQDPLFGMMVADGSLEVVGNKEDLKRAENDPEKKPEKADPVDSAAPAEGKPSGRKSAENKA